ncbi:MAG TPA: hypothetical protein VNB94_05490 [Mycobacteriales bacterium]|nr:hypothetical protein [Mycobacteriales bacterium]
MPIPARSRVLSLAVLMAFSTACGSTVQGAGQAGGSVGQAGADTTGSGPGAGLEVPGAGVGAGSTNGTGTTPAVGGSTAGGGGFGSGPTMGGSGSGGGRPGSTGGAPGSRPGGGGTSGSGGTTGAGGSAPVGPGVTATEIRLGIPYCTDCSSGNAAAGAVGEDTGDTRRYYNEALREVNSRGGVLGRKLVPVFHPVSVSTDIEQSRQQACETFTKDNKVLAIFFQGETTYACALKAGIIATGASGTGPIYDRFPNLFAPASIRLERLAENTVKAMVKAGWHKPEPKWPTGKIGIISWDNAEYRYAMDKGWLPTMRNAGLKPTDVRYVAVPQNFDGIGDAQAAIANAVLRFNEQKIDHVFISDGPAGVFTGAGLTLLFMQNAKSQRYYPRYGLNTNNVPDFDSHPQDQLVGMIAIDSSSTEPANDEGITPNPQRERCLSLMRKAGLPVGQEQSRAVALGACEIAWFAEAIIKNSRSTLLADMIAGGESLGTSYRSPNTYGTKIGPGLRDGSRLFRNLQFDEECECLRYTSKAYEP